MSTVKKKFLEEISSRYGKPKKATKSYSLYDIPGQEIKIYIRYSKIHSRKQAFYGLRKEDLEQLEGQLSFICFLWESQREPLIVPFYDYEDVFQTVSPASDGQYKVQVYIQDEATELYIPRAGRFNVESHLGWHTLEEYIEKSTISKIPDLSHSQVQTLLGAIGNAKNYDVYVPPSDRSRLDWSVSEFFECRQFLPSLSEHVTPVLQEIDVIWISKGSNELKALFEVEHSTPIYSGLLRFNDVLLAAPNLNPRFTVVSNETRRSIFVKQINRPTFVLSKLNEFCTFLEYANVFGWYNRVVVK